jgi:hypothetical protein
MPTSPTALPDTVAAGSGLNEATNNQRRIVMTRPRVLGWIGLIAANVALLGVLGFYQTTATAKQPAAAKPPFANAIEQRMEMIGHLKEIKELLREQNALLRSGGKLTASPIDRGKK